MYSEIETDSFGFKYTYQIGRSGSGKAVHVVLVNNPGEGHNESKLIDCGSEQFNGSGNGRLSGVAAFDLTKITCKKCLKRINKT